MPRGGGWCGRMQMPVAGIRVAAGGEWMRVESTRALRTVGLFFLLLTVLLLLAALWLFSGALVAGCAAVAALASAGFALLFGSWLTGKLGGLTGDMYGAAAELAEVVALLAFILSAYIK